MTTFDLLLFAHIAGAIGWVGGDILLQLLGTRTVNHGSGAEIQTFITNIVYLTPRWFIPVSVWTIVFGVATALEGSYSMGDTWLVAGLAMFVLSFLIGLLYLGPQSERIQAIGESEGPESSSYAANVKRLILASRVELALLMLIVLVMVAKPG